MQLSHCDALVVLQSELPGREPGAEEQSSIGRSVEVGAQKHLNVDKVDRWLRDEHVSPGAVWMLELGLGLILLVGASFRAVKLRARVHLVADSFDERVWFCDDGVFVAVNFSNALGETVFRSHNFAGVYWGKVYCSLNGEVCLQSLTPGLTNSRSDNDFSHRQEADDIAEEFVYGEYCVGGRVGVRQCHGSRRSGVVRGLLACRVHATHC